ncbi:hypothetical protein M405DRAFT_881437 [Rhizopogon salebrosus TDB-379]|nr:hypothetical protein M405DRAFT_881437 [Rhizopogon salebrosus TDB-379]
MTELRRACVSLCETVTALAAHVFRFLVTVVLASRPYTRLYKFTTWTEAGYKSFCLTQFIFVILDWCAGNLATNHTCILMQTFRRAIYCTSTNQSQHHPPSTVSLPQTQPPTTHQHVPLSLPQPVRVPLPQYQVWTCMTNSRILPKWVWWRIDNVPTLRVSRAMQYVDPYAAVRVSLGTSTKAPPSDEPYTKYL